MASADDPSSHRDALPPPAMARPDAPQAPRERMARRLLNGMTWEDMESQLLEMPTGTREFYDAIDYQIRRYSTQIATAVRQDPSMRADIFGQEPHAQARNRVTARFLLRAAQTEDREWRDYHIDFQLRKMAQRRGQHRCTLSWDQWWAARHPDDNHTDVEGEDIDSLTDWLERAESDEE